LDLGLGLGVSGEQLRLGEISMVRHGLLNYRRLGHRAVLAY